MKKSNTTYTLHNLVSDINSKQLYYSLELCNYLSSILNWSFTYKRCKIYINLNGKNYLFLVRDGHYCGDWYLYDKKYSRYSFDNYLLHLKRISNSSFSDKHFNKKGYCYSIGKYYNKISIKHLQQYHISSISYNNILYTDRLKINKYYSNQ